MVIRIMEAAHALKHMRLLHRLHGLAKHIITGRQQISKLGITNTLFENIAPVAIRITYNVKQNAYRCLPPGGNPRCCCSR